MQKRWRLVDTPTEALETLMVPDELHPIARRLLWQRGLRTSEEVRAFLDPVWSEGVHDPFLFAQMRAATDRVFMALERGERLTIHGDYDADGVTGSTVVVTVLRYLENLLKRTDTRIDTYIPHRDKEGYGVHERTVHVLHERGTQLLITVDCGIACTTEIALAKSLGIETIVLDHHQFGETLPDGFLIHPRLPGETYPFPHLAAVGVAWKFACALLTNARERGWDIPEGWEKWLLDLVSIATVTDMVPLVGENRLLLKYGLLVMNKTRRTGLKALLEAVGRTPGSIDSETIGFLLGPRINAAGRMEHASLALELLLTDSPEEAHTLTVTLEEYNRRRQKTTERMMAEVEKTLADTAQDSIVVVWNAEWSPSLVGLVAGKVLDRTGKPCVAIGKHGDAWIGSGRSPLAYNVTEAVKRAGEGFLTRAGGHDQACGFSFVRDEDASRLAEALRTDAASRLRPEDLVPEIEIAAEMGFDDIDWRLLETLKRFEPFGMGNPRPLFTASGLEVLSADTVGATQAHLRCVLRTPGGRSQKCIAFKQGKRREEMEVGRHVDVVYDVGVNEWNGRRELQCQLTDFRRSDV